MENVLNMDAFVEGLTGAISEMARFPSLLKTLKIIPEFEKYQGGKLKILLVGYNGARNTGADVRVEGMVRQFYHILGDENIHIRILSLDPSHTSIYFKPPTEIIELSSIFFHPLLKSCSSSHMAVLSEGSCFKSKFANALTTFFFGASGIMKSQDKPCIAYGSEAGYMDFLLSWFVKRYCKDTYILSRTEQSCKEVEKLGLKGTIGTDTAWIFPPGDKRWAIKTLKKKGWDGKKPILGVAVINPFWWPVRPNLLKFMKMKMLKEEREDNYDKWYFYSVSKEREKSFQRYIKAIADAVNDFAAKHNVFTVILGMERLDYQAVMELQKQIKGAPPVFWSQEYNGYEMTAILHKLSMLVTSRYHARVLSMPAGVPSAAISMDERLYNLLSETGHLDKFYLDTSDPQLPDKLPAIMEKLWDEREEVSEELLRCVPTYLRKMADMGKVFKRFVREKFPDLRLKEDPDHWTGYLPPLYPLLEEVLSKYGAD